MHLAHWLVFLNAKVARLTRQLPAHLRLNIGQMTTLKQASNNDFLEAAESTEDERIAIQFASKNDELSQALEEDSDSSDKASAWGR
jgi:hypothetical protein